MSGSLNISGDSKECENITKMDLQGTCSLQLHVELFTDFSPVKCLTQTQEFKKITVISVFLPKEENVLFTSFVAMTEKQNKENQAFGVFVPELKLSRPSSVCPSLATF